VSVLPRVRHFRSNGRRSCWQSICRHRLDIAWPNSNARPSPRATRCWLEFTGASAWRWRRRPPRSSARSARPS